MKKFDYENKQYLDKLNSLHGSYYSKYISFIKKYVSGKNSVFLDVGCGNGVTLSKLKKSGYSNGYGVDISKLFVESAKQKKLNNIYLYDGLALPFRDGFFDLIGSFNVLEHTDNPQAFLKQQLLKIKKKGFIIVACPNFLSSLLPSPHPKIKGVGNRVRNLLTVINKIIFPKYGFKKMKPIFREIFEYDDDAIVETNLIDLRNFMKKNNCKIIYESGFINYDNFMYKLVNSIPVLRYILPSCFIVAQKL